ncbi:site-specific integrase [Listeria monocytogenes]|uniref:tyrosine-type recombinase/integrase n=1 Tax=Listeria monocytogenes TaxID=1639 RepID=UPI0010E12D0E|nr:site-specific integrase [Listeria monocytogenes]EAE2793835.1 site-specific integrase [Listeria monocytogenes]EAE4464087.1 site-specific integrase [Listeria monocytogenes]HCO9085463.1 site-specific integrase [Listeria monocytogenes]
MAKTKYAGVYTDSKGQFYYETDLGIDRVTGKRLRKKGRKNQQGKKFTSATQAYKELIRVKNECLSTNGYANYKMTYGQFMEAVYIPAYKTDVEESTFSVRERTLERMSERFYSIPLRSISIEDVQQYRTWLLSEDGADYSQAYASLVFGMFRKSLEMAVDMQYLEQNVSKKVKAIPKGKSVVPYWTKTEFEKVITTICLDDIYEHLCFVMLWVYFMTGVRVNEGTALWWEDVDFENKRLRVHHSLFIKTKSDWTRKNYTKTADGKRILSLDDDTIRILREWKQRQETIGIRDFIFSYDGMPMIKSTIARIIERYSKIAKVHRIQAKGLRHSHASYLINEFNVSVLILSKRMGHSSPEITLKHYSHMWSGIDESIAQEMTGNIQISTASKTNINFNGNKAIKRN